MCSGSSTRSLAPQPRSTASFALAAWRAACDEASRWPTPSSCPVLPGFCPQSGTCGWPFHWHLATTWAANCPDSMLCVQEQGGRRTGWSWGGQCMHCSEHSLWGGACCLVQAWPVAVHQLQQHCRRWPQTTSIAVMEAGHPGQGTSMWHRDLQGAGAAGMSPGDSPVAGRLLDGRATTQLTGKEGVLPTSAVPGRAGRVGVHREPAASAGALSSHEGGRLHGQGHQVDGPAPTEALHGRGARAAAAGSALLSSGRANRDVQKAGSPEHQQPTWPQQAPAHLWSTTLSRTGAPSREPRSAQTGRRGP